MDCHVCKAPGMCVCPSDMYNRTVEQILKRQRIWSEKTFGPGARIKGIIEHIQKELHEILVKPTDLEEWIDIVILALDGAWRTGAHLDEIVATLYIKQMKNEKRSWPDWRRFSEDQAIEHNRDCEEEQP